MNYIRNAILATLVYYDILDFPLTILEIHNLLINPGRLSKLQDGVGEISLAHIDSELENMLRIGIVGDKNGFYFLPGREDIYSKRINREKITSAKWKKFLKLSRWFMLAPYIKGLFSSGSLALNNANRESDFDVLVIARSGRLYTSRLFLWLISSLLGARRRRFDAVAPDKFCLNHYITDKSLTISHESLYNAQTYSNLKPILIDEELVRDFYASNIWINKFVHNFKINYEFTRRTIIKNRFFAAVANFLEFLLDSKLGDKVEQMARKYQHERIKGNPITYEKGGRVTFTDDELEFHPHSFEAVVIRKYNEGIRRLGIVPYIEEKDSGLTR